MTGTFNPLSRSSTSPAIMASLAIGIHARELGDAPGAAVSEVESVGTGYRIRYQNGAIYKGPRVGPAWAYGAIGDHYDTLGGCTGWLGFPKIDETGTPDGVGRYNHFEHGSIYWTPSTGAFEVHGAIRDKWASLGWETCFLGYPITDETGTPDGRGRYNHFEHGSIYWNATSGAFERHDQDLPGSFTAHGDIRFADSTPVGGTADLVLHSDGTFLFSGHLHDSGAPDYSDSVTCIVAVKTTAKAYTFTHTGVVHGDLPGSRNDDWNDAGSKQELIDSWIDLCAGHEVTFATTVGVDFDGLVALVKQYYPYVEMVVALF